MLEGIGKKSFSEQKGSILKPLVRRVFQNERVPFEGIGKEFFFWSGERLLEGVDKKGFSERKGVILKASVRRFFQSGRVPFEGIRKEFFF